MIFAKSGFLLLAGLLCAAGQGIPAPATQDPPLSLQDLSDYLTDSTLAASDIPLIMQDMQRNGIDFFLESIGA